MLIYHYRSCYPLILWVPAMSLGASLHSILHKLLSTARFTRARWWHLPDTTSTLRMRMDMWKITGRTVHIERIQHACTPWYSFWTVFMNSVFKHEVLIQKCFFFVLFLKEEYPKKLIKKEKCYSSWWIPVSIIGIFELPCSMYVSTCCLVKMVFHLLRFKTMIYCIHMGISIRWGSFDVLYQASVYVNCVLLVG